MHTKRTRTNTVREQRVREHGLHGHTADKRTNTNMFANSLFANASRVKSELHRVVPGRQGVRENEGGVPARGQRGEPVHTAEEKAQDRRARRPVNAPLEQQQHQHPPVDVNEPRWRSRTNTNERVREQLVREHGPGSASAANEHNAHERTGVREQCSRTLANTEHWKDR